MAELALKPVLVATGTETADDVYQLIKSYEKSFTPPAQYFDIQVGTLNVDTGAYSGLTTTSETDPEPVEHGPHDTPHNPPPRFVGERYITVSIDKSWKRTITSSPAPHVPLQPVLLKFSLSRPVPGGWSVSVNGETIESEMDQTTINVNLWDQTFAFWTIEAAGISHSDRLYLQRSPGKLASDPALGAFTVPVLPVSIVYAPPADSLGKSTASYTQGSSVGQTSSIENTTEASTTSTSSVKFSTFLNVAAASLGSTNPVLSGIFSNVATALPSISSSDTSDISDQDQWQMTITESTSTGLSTSTAGGGPGVGDIFHYLHNVQFAWAYFEGELKLCPLSYKHAAFPARAIQQGLPGVNLSAADASALLALDPFVSGQPGAALNPDRFQYIETWEYGYGATIPKAKTVTRETKSQETHTTLTTQTDEWDIGPIANILGFGGKDTTSLKLSNAVGSDVAETVTISAILSSGPQEHFSVNLYYDILFGTFAFQMDNPSVAARLKGKGAKPFAEVQLLAAGKTFVTVADKAGAFAFYSPRIPKGKATLKVGTKPSRTVSVNA